MTIMDNRIDNFDIGMQLVCQELGDRAKVMINNEPLDDRTPHNLRLLILNLGQAVKLTVDGATVISGFRMIGWARRVAQRGLPKYLKGGVYENRRA